jgi:hypothetical protein
MDWNHHVALLWSPEKITCGSRVTEVFDGLIDEACYKIRMAVCITKLLQAKRADRGPSARG